MTFGVKPRAAPQVTGGQLRVGTSPEQEQEAKRVADQGSIRRREKQLAFQYTTIVETINLDIGAASSASPDDISRAQGEGLNHQIQRVGQSADTIDGGGWEIFSFDQLLLPATQKGQPGRLATTFLLRRERDG